MSIRWRRLLTKSWALSWCYYLFHGHRLQGRPSDEVWYFAYGANMHDSAFRERRGMRPLDWRPGRIKGYRLRFNLEGRPKGKAAPANICRDPGAEVWGLLYKITRQDLLHLDSTEGVPGRRYRPIWHLRRRDSLIAIRMAICCHLMPYPRAGSISASSHPPACGDAATLTICF
jgi:hypothetical protein